MSTTRLFILGALARIGPMHGHQIRREAQLSRTESWANIKPGSLYGALQRMEREGLIEIVRTEQEGNRPERTIYAITDAGRSEMIALRDAILRDARLRSDPVDLAIQFLRDDLTIEEATLDIKMRLRSIRDQISTYVHARDHADPYINDMERMIYDHVLRRLEVERLWHEDLLARLPELIAAIPPDDI